MATASKYQILVVDDDPSLREILGMVLKSVGYDVAVADSGIAAVQHLRNAVPDLIVTDLHLPEMSGLELIAHVRTQYPSILVIAMSGDYYGDAVPAGFMADRFYTKGQNTHYLLTTIATLIATGPRRGTTD